MDQVEARLKILELAKPAASNPDVSLWLERSRQLEAYVLGAGHTAEKAAPAEAKTVKASTTKARTTAE